MNSYVAAITKEVTLKSRYDAMTCMKNCELAVVVSRLKGSSEWLNNRPLYCLPVKAEQNPIPIVILLKSI